MPINLYHGNILRGWSAYFDSMQTTAIFDYIWNIFLNFNFKDENAISFNENFGVSQLNLKKCGTYKSHLFWCFKYKIIMFTHGDLAIFQNRVFSLLKLFCFEIFSS